MTGVVYVTDEINIIGVSFVVWLLLHGVNRRGQA